MRKKTNELHCEFCGADFYPSNKAQVYCSKPCSNSAAAGQPKPLGTQWSVRLSQSWAVRPIA